MSRYSALVAPRWRRIRRRTTRAGARLNSVDAELEVAEFVEVLLQSLAILDAGTGPPRRNALVSIGCLRDALRLTKNRSRSTTIVHEHQA